ncbi:hypothetical protein EV378_1240 [Pseudonocardia endophytica]|uniref:Uncharacterized protein n=2 Tax=Pseudonocardia endophytica TaxID=401976 RepID=A0A4R1I5T3_PSEEN|nr:hypothetical protein EV378_1240 [Pseudonocardia endophytica]
MAELFEAVVSWPTLLMVLLVFGLAPGLVLRIVVLCYPKGDPRRRELVAELYVLSFVHRPLWVMQQVETAVFEGVAARWKVRGGLSSVAPRQGQRTGLMVASTLFVGLFSATVIVQPLSEAVYDVTVWLAAVALMLLLTVVLMEIGRSTARMIKATLR